MHTLARVAKASQTQDYEWTPIRDTAPRSPNFGNSSHASAFVPSSHRPKARLARPPNLPFTVPAPYGISPPESPLPGHDGYVQPRRSVKSVRQGNVERRRPSVRPISTVDGSEHAAVSAAKCSDKAGSPTGVRTGDVAKLPRLKNRISTVSQYPVLVSTDRSSYVQSVASDGRTRARGGTGRRRPISIASTSTTGIYLAVAALPGSEPFDLPPPSQGVLERHDGSRAALTHATMHPPQQRPGSLLRPMLSAAGSRTSAAQDEQRTTTTAENNGKQSQLRYSLVSRMPTNFAGSETSSRRTVSDCDESINSDDEGIAEEEGGCDNDDDVHRHHVARDGQRPRSELDARHLQWLEETAAPSRASAPHAYATETAAPVPPPKDSKYLLRLPRSDNISYNDASRASMEARTLRPSASTPNLSATISPPPMERTGILRERRGTWYEQPVTIGRGWLSTLRGGRPGKQSGDDGHNVRSKTETMTMTADEKQPQGILSRNKRSQLFTLWSRIIGRAMPRLGVHDNKS